MKARLLPLLLVVAAAAACKPSEPKTAAGGEAYFRQLNCQACHLIGAEGSPRGGPDLTMVGFRKSAAWLDLYLKDPKAWHPGTRMPDPRLSETARAKLVEYLSGLKGQDWGQARPWKGLSGAEQGHVLYARAGCVTCHGVAGAGGYPNNNVPGKAVPGLAGIQDRFTKAELKKKIARGVVPEKADPSGPKPLLEMPAWAGALDESELDAVVEYLWTLKGGAPAAGAAW